HCADHSSSHSSFRLDLEAARAWSSPSQHPCHCATHPPSFTHSLTDSWEQQLTRSITAPWTTYIPHLLMPPADSSLEFFIGPHLHPHLPSWGSSSSSPSVPSCS